MFIIFYGCVSGGEWVFGPQFTLLSDCFKIVFPKLWGSYSTEGEDWHSVMPVRNLILH